MNEVTGAHVGALISDYVGVLDGPQDQSFQIFELLGLARENGCRTAILSNDPGGPGAAPLRDLVGSVVDDVVLSGDVGFGKPDRRIFELVARRLGVPTRACVFIDDSPVNVWGAVDAGMIGVHHVDAAATVREVRILLAMNEQNEGGSSVAPTAHNQDEHAHNQDEHGETPHHE
ncbi:MAG: HAD-IA family hydrolase [Rhodococcus sp.]|nr:HAD-IA family hydrolase [Rhodococcus sp. (in: high G+C Gram-positive bacteria)]